MIKILRYLCLCIFCCNCVNLYAGALDDLVSQKHTEKLEKEKQKQKKEKQEQQLQRLLIDIADCEQAVAKAIEKRNAISKKPINVFNSGFVIPDSDGLLYKPSGDVRVVGFDSDGVFVFGHTYFIYTSDTDYATNETFRGNNLIYERVGNYKYTTTTGEIRSVPAYKATSYKVSEINPKTYLKNKELSCCQYNEEKTEEFKEIGVEVKTHCSDFINRIHKSPDTVYPVSCGGNNRRHACFTTKHPKGAENSQAICTGTNYQD